MPFKRENVLVVVDMQNDFVHGALGSPEALAIVPAVIRKIKGWDGSVYFTRDTHDKKYLKTHEGRALPVIHCVKDSWGWEILPELEPLRTNEPIDKTAFGSVVLERYLMDRNSRKQIPSVTLIGLCTDVCVITNAFMLRSALPEAEIIVDAACCAGTTPKGHQTALAAMKACHITIENEPNAI